MKKIVSIFFLTLTFSQEIFAQRDTTLKCEEFSERDTLIINSEYSNCENMGLNKLKVYCLPNKVYFTFFDQYEVLLSPKLNLTKHKRKMAKRILDKLEKRIELSSVESIYAAKRIKDKDGLFNMIEEYKHKDTTILNYNFDKLKNGLLSFEKSLRVNYKRNDFSCPDKKCRIKIAFNINSSSKQYIYYVDGCEKLKAMLFKSLGLRN